LGLILALSGALVALALLSLTLGRYPVSLSDVPHLLVAAPSDDAPWVVVMLVRLPRILLAALCGMGLALCGAAMQGLFRNPLVGPEICGVQAGATLGGVIALLLDLPQLDVTGLAFVGGMLALAAAMALARAGGAANLLALALAGVIVGGFCQALVGLLETLADPNGKLPVLLYWLLGSFAGADYDKLLVVAAVTLGAGSAILALRWRINLLSLDETDAMALGVNTARLRWALLALTALICAAQVAASGGVGWIGLVIPHLARFMVGPEHARLLPVSALLGGLYLLAMDDLSRSAAATEIPIGLLTSALGAPAFALLVWRTQRQGASHD